MDIINFISGAFIMIGSLSIIVGLLGVYRMPDFYTRLHAASIIDTLGAILILFGLILYYGLNIVSLKLLLILFIQLKGEKQITLFFILKLIILLILRVNPEKKRLMKKKCGIQLQLVLEKQFIYYFLQLSF